MWSRFKQATSQPFQWHVRPGEQVRTQGPVIATEQSSTYKDCRSIYVPRGRCIDGSKEAAGLSVTVLSEWNSTEDLT
jgi:hypothetical protein